MDVRVPQQVVDGPGASQPCAAGMCHTAAAAAQEAAETGQRHVLLAAAVAGVALVTACTGCKYR